MSQRQHFNVLKSSAFHQGFTLVELMVSLAIGMVVVGAMYASYIATSANSKTSRAVSQMTEDASVALNILRAHISSASYKQPTGIKVVNGTNKFQDSNLTNVWIFGCDGNFLNSNLVIASLTCSNPLTGSHALAVAYEANGATNAYASGVAPTDCLGNAITGTVVSGKTYYLSDSRFYISGNALYCRFPGASGQPLVENIKDMQITYGVMPAAQALSVAAYRTAAQVQAAGIWGQVASVRVCLLVQSASEVMDAVTPYVGCDPFAAATTPTDRRMYRAFTSTIVLTNRIGVPP